VTVGGIESFDGSDMVITIWSWKKSDCHGREMRPLTAHRIL